MTSLLGEAVILLAVLALATVEKCKNINTAGTAVLLSMNAQLEWLVTHSLALRART